MSLKNDYAALFDRVPVAWSEVVYAGRRYGLTRSVAAGGRARAVYAEELGGRDVVSANLYVTAGGPQLRACERAAAKAVDFLARFEPIGGSSSTKLDSISRGSFVPNGVQARVF